MAGSSRDHERGARLPDELSDILRSLFERQTNILYHALTNQHVRGYFLDLLQNRVTEIAENHTRAAAGHSSGTPTVLSKPMLKQRPALLKTTTAVAPYRPPGSSVAWRPNVVSYIVPPPPLPPPSSPPPEASTAPLAALPLKRFVQRLPVLLRFLMFSHLASCEVGTEAVLVADLRQLKPCLEETPLYKMNNLLASLSAKDPM